MWRREPSGVLACRSSTASRRRQSARPTSVRQQPVRSRSYRAACDCRRARWSGSTAAVRQTALPLPPRPYWSPRLSPDGRRIAVGIEGATHDVWVSDVERDTLTRLTFGSDNYLPVWSPDGTRIAFQSNRTGPWNVFWAPLDRSSSEEQLIGGDNTPVPSSFSPDGQTLTLLCDEPPDVGRRVAGPRQPASHAEAIREHGRARGVAGGVAEWSLDRVPVEPVWA